MPRSRRWRRSATQAGFAVTTASDGRQGLLEFRQGLFDPVVLDVMLSELDGFEVCREIRRGRQDEARNRVEG
jgi:DNA-binding response OmpR family regulator